MAHTANMIRLMQYAADLLDACQPMANAREVEATTEFITITPGGQA